MHIFVSLGARAGPVGLSFFALAGAGPAGPSLPAADAGPSLDPTSQLLPNSLSEFTTLDSDACLISEFTTLDSDA